MLPDVAAIGQWNGEAVTKTTYAFQGAEVVIKGAVLLHQNHNVLYVLDGARLVIGRDGERLADAGRKGGQRAGCQAGTRHVT